MLLPTVWTTREREREDRGSRTITCRSLARLSENNFEECARKEVVREDPGRRSPFIELRASREHNGRAAPSSINYLFDRGETGREKGTDRQRERGGKNEEDRNDLPISHDQRQPCEGKVYLSRRESARKHLQRPVPRILDRPR